MARKPVTRKPRKPLGPVAKAGKERFRASYKSGPTSNANVLGVRSEVAGMSRAERVKYFKQIERNTQKDQTPFSLTSGGMGTPKDLPGVLMQNLPGTTARSGSPTSGTKPTKAGAFASGVSASSLQFVKERAESKYGAGESEAGKQTKNKKGGKRQKLVKKAAKAGAKGKAVRRALKTPGLRPGERKVYRSTGSKSLTKKLVKTDRSKTRRKS